jgi:hypothetical protein
VHLSLSPHAISEPLRRIRFNTCLVCVDVHFLQTKSPLLSHNSGIIRHRHKNKIGPAQRRTAVLQIRSEGAICTTKILVFNRHYLRSSIKLVSKLHISNLELVITGCKRNQITWCGRKVQLSHANVWESGDTAPRILNLDTRTTWLGQLHALAPTGQEDGWVPDSVWVLWRRKMKQCRESNPGRAV